jgi:hypothetical protein
MDKEIREFIPCECGAEAVVLSYWPDDEDKMIFLSMWAVQPGGRFYDWRHKIQHIWHILKKGHPYTDDIVLNLKEVERLRNALTRAIAEIG